MLISKVGYQCDLKREGFVVLLFYVYGTGAGVSAKNFPPCQAQKLMRHSVFLSGICLFVSEIRRASHAFSKTQNDIIGSLTRSGTSSIYRLFFTFNAQRPCR